MDENRTMKKYKPHAMRLGPNMQKVLLIFSANIALGLAATPSRQLRVLRDLSEEWKEIDRRALHAAIQKLYRSKLVERKEYANGVTRLVINEAGRKKALVYNKEVIQIKKTHHWDSLWRVVMFDIPEDKKKARDALSTKLKQMGMRSVQKSVFISPYPCKDEVDFIIELFNIRPYVRFLVVKEIDTDLELRHTFDLS